MSQRDPASVGSGREPVESVDAGESVAANESAHAGPFGRAAALLLGIQAGVLFGFAIYYVVELVRGEGDSQTRVAMSAVVIVVFGVLLLLVSVRGWRGEGWARTANGMWQVLLVPVGISLIQSDQRLLGVALLVVAALTLAGLALDRATTE